MTAFAMWIAGWSSTVCIPSTSTGVESVLSCNAGACYTEETGVLALKANVTGITWEYLQANADWNKTHAVE